MSRTTDVSGLVNAVTGAASQPVFSVVGTLLQFISPPEQNRGNLSVMIGGIPARAVIPLHSHSDPEVFYVLEGSMEVFQDDGISSYSSIIRVTTHPLFVRKCWPNSLDTEIQTRR